MSEADQIRLRHMLDAAAEAVSFAVGRSRRDLDQDRMLVLSLVKSIEILGEAANKISPDMKRECPEISWEDIVSMRHRLIHAYFDVNLDVVWSTVERDLPELIDALKMIIRKDR